MSNDYLNPFGANNISSSTSTSSVGSVSVADNSDASIMVNNSSSTMNYILSPSDLKEDDIELIKKELERKIQEQKEDLENAKNTRGWLTSAANSVAGWFGGGDKKAQNNISNYEALLSGLDSDISNIDEVYKTIMGTELDLASLQSLKSSEALANSIDSQTQNAIVAELENQVALLEGNFETVQNSNGWISGTWNAFKNWTGIGASSNKTSAEINDLKEQIEKLKNGEADLATTFKNITGTDLNAENLTSLLSGEVGTGLDSVSTAGQSVNAYSEGQKMCSDVVGDMVSGIVAVGALAAAPFTGGASLLLAAGVGAGVKVAIKASDCIGNEKTYGLKDLGYDLVTGSINGAMAPISNGLGGAAGTGMAKLFGLKAAESVAKEGLEQAVKVAGKEVLEEVVEEGAEQASKGIISRILAKQGTEYVLKEGAEATAKTTIGKIASYATDMAVDGALSGATDGFARAAAEGRWEDIPQEMLQGGLGGLIASPIIGGGFRVAGKAGSTVINKINNKITIGSLLPDGTMTKFSQGEIGDCALLSMLDGFLGNSKTAKQIQNAITTSTDGGYNVKIGSQTVKIAREELTDEMLSDTTGIRVFELAYQKAGGSLDGEFAENVAKTFGLNPVHITSDGITDEVLETISKDSDNLILSLGARVDAEGTITPDGEFQHYFSIKNVDPETRTLTLVDTYDTSKTFEMSFDDVKTQGVSIDGGSVKKTDLPNVERSADEVGFRGVVDNETVETVIPQKTFSDYEKIQLIEKLDYDPDFINGLIDEIEYIDDEVFPRLITILQNDNIVQMVKSGDINLEEVFYNWTNLPDEHVVKILNLINKGEYSDLEYLKIVLPEEQFASVENLLQDEKIATLFQNGILKKDTLSQIFGSPDEEVIKQAKALLSSDNLLNLIQQEKINGNEFNALIAYNSPEVQENFLRLLDSSEIYNFLLEDKVNFSALLCLADNSAENINKLVSTIKKENVLKLISEGNIDIQKLSDWTRNFSDKKLDSLLTIYTDDSLKEILKNRLFSEYDFRSYAEKLSDDSFENVLDLLKNEKILELLNDKVIGRYELGSLFTQLSDTQINNLKDFLTNDNVISLIKNKKLNLRRFSSSVKNYSEEKIVAFFELHKNKSILELYDSGLVDTWDVSKWLSKYSDSQYSCIMELYTNKNFITLLKDETYSQYDLESLIEKTKEENLGRVKTLLTNKGVADLHKESKIYRWDLEKYLNEFSDKQFDDFIKLANSGNFSEHELSRIILPKEQFAILDSIINNPKINPLIENGIISYSSLKTNIGMLSNEELVNFDRLLNNENVLKLLDNKNVKIGIGDLRSYCQKFNSEQFEQLVAVFNEGKFSQREILRIELTQEQFVRYEKITSNETLASFQEKGILNEYDLRQWGSCFTEEQSANLDLILSNEKMLELLNNKKMDKFDLERLINNYSAEQISKINNALTNTALFDLITDGKISFYNIKNWIEKNSSECLDNLIQILNDETFAEAIKSGGLSTWDIEKLMQCNSENLNYILTVVNHSDCTDLFKSNKLGIMTYLNKVADLSETEISRFNKLLTLPSMLDLIKNKKLASYEDYGYDRLLSWSKELTDDEFDNLLNVLSQEGVLEALNKNGKWDYFSKNRATIYGIETISKLKDVDLKNQILDIVNKNPDALKLVDDVLELTNDIGILVNVSDKLSKGLNDSNIEDLIILYKYLNLNTTDLSALSSKEKISLNHSVNTIKGLFETEGLFETDEITQIISFSDIVAESVKHTIVPTQITSANMKNMMSGFFANNSASLDELLSTTDFTQFGKQGLPLEYSRSAFVNDLLDSLKDIPQEEQTQITRKLGITFTKDESGNIIGYDGIIDLSKLSNDGIEGNVLSLATKFIKENSIITGDSELDNALNSLIEGMPEFINIIGKQQHQTQTLSIDAHILTVLKEAMANENYQNLSDLDKTCLKFSTILHDIAKSEGIVDTAHPDASALYARNILEKYTFSDNIKDRIFELVKNHHWLEKYNKGEVTSDYIASLFRHKDDYSIAKIMADADLKGVSEEFYNTYSDALNTERQIPVLESLYKINSTGQLVFTSKIIKDNLIPTVEHNGSVYKVIDFTKMSKSADLSQYGFTPGTTVDSARFYVHMADSAENLETVDCLSDVANGSFLCASYISTGNKNTYNNSKFGVSLEAENVNIANAANENQCSGGHKGFDIFSEIISGNDDQLSHYRDTIPTRIKNQLHLNEREYAELYQMFASKKHISQIKDNEIYTVGRKTLRGDRIKKAIQTAGNDLFSPDSHNESNLYNPKINAFVAKVNSIEEIPESFLKFVQAHNLPIYLLGE